MEPEPTLNDEQIRANRYQLVSRLADDLAHEIKNPLNAIVINLELMKVRMARGDAESALDRAGVIEEETRRLHGLIDRLLQLLRPVREDAASLALDQVLDETLPLTAAQARLSRNQFAVRGDASVFVPVPRDVFKFTLLNVLTAVHELMGEGTGTLHVAVDAGDELVRIDVYAAADADDWQPSAEYDRLLADAIGMARSTLRPCGAVVTARPLGATIELPRAAAV